MAGGLDNVSGGGALLGWSCCKGGGGVCLSEGCEKECMGWGSRSGGDGTRDPFTDCTPALDDGGVGKVGKSRLSVGGDSYFIGVAFILMASSTEGPEEIRASSCCSERVPKRGKIAGG